MTLQMSDDEVRTVIEAVRDGTATPEQHRELELLLRQDANARRYYVQYQLLCVDLQAILPAHDRDEPAAAPPAEDGCHREGFGIGRATDRMGPERRRKGARTHAEGPTPAGTAAGASRRRWAWRIGAAAAVLLMLALGSPWVLRLRGTRPVPAARQDATLATLVAAMDAQWGRDAGLAIAGATAGKLDGLLGNGRDPDTCPQWVSPGRWSQQRALRFDASRRQRLRVPHSNELNITQSLTIAAWIRPHTALLQATAAIATKRTASGDTAQPNYELALIHEQDERGEVQCGLCFRSGSRRVASAGMPVVPGRWMHVAAVANGGQCVLYVDGRRVATGDSADFVPNEGDLWIGTIPGDPQAAGANENESFEGLISELVLVRRMLSETEIHAMWSAGKPEP